jgi:hypothetical protein
MIIRFWRGFNRVNSGGNGGLFRVLYTKGNDILLKVNNPSGLIEYVKCFNFPCGY